MAENNSSAPLKTAEGEYPAPPEPATWLVVRGAFRASPHGQDAESNEWLEEAHEPGEKGSFAVYTEQQLKDFADATHAMRLKCKSEQKRLATLWGFQAAPAAVAAPATKLASLVNELRMLAAVQEPEYPNFQIIIEEAAKALESATPALPATEDSWAGDLVEADLSQISGGETPKPWSVAERAGLSKALGTVFRDQAEVQAEPVAWQTFDGEGGHDYRSYKHNESYLDDWNRCNPNHKGWVEPLYTAPQAQPADALDAETIKKAARYDWLRKQHWSDSQLCVVLAPKTQTKLGSICPSMARLDEVIDAAMAAAQEGGKA